MLSGCVAFAATAMLAALLLPIASGSGINQLLNLNLFDAATLAKFGSRCLDGSPAGFYFRGAVNPSNTGKYIIFLQGGGLCTSIPDCQNRSKTDQGSSANWAKTREQQFSDNMLNADPTLNPRFYDYNAIWVPYCSGDLYKGQNIKPSPVSGNLWFAGHPIVEALLDTLLNKYGLGKAEEVILSGDSAGGIGAFYHADFLSDYMANLTSGRARVVATPQAGWFSVSNTYAQWLVDPSTPYVVPPPTNDTIHFYLDVVQQWIPSVCSNAVPAEQFYVCDSVPFYYQFIKTPIFTAENVFDSYQVFVAQGAPYDLLDPKVNAYIRYQGVQMRQSLTERIINGPAQQNNGLFATSCLRHELQFTGSFAVSIQGKTYAQAFADWYDKTDSKPRIYLDTAGYPTCFGVDQTRPIAASSK